MSQVSPLSRRHVLLAEDNTVSQQVVIELLQTRGHSVKLAENGIAVLSALEQESFDIVLMDGEMPEMDGFQTTVAIREREKESGGHIRIVAMTGLTMESDRERCLAAGMDGYLCKPIRAKELFEAIEQGNVV
jgi:CheY-like chemotaxis protein